MTIFRGGEPRYLEFRGLYSRVWTEPIRPHYIDVDAMEAADRTAEAVDWMWAEATRCGIPASDLALAVIAVRGLGTRQAPGGEAMRIAVDGCARGVDVAAQFLESVDGSGYARYSLFIMEEARRREGYRYVAAHDAAEALHLILSTAERGRGRGGPFDVGVYEVTSDGRKRRYHPMVWSGASDRDALRLPEAMRRDLTAAGVDLPETCSLTGARAALAGRGRGTAGAQSGREIA